MCGKPWLVDCLSPVYAKQGSHHEPDGAESYNGSGGGLKESIVGNFILSYEAVKSHKEIFIFTLQPVAFCFCPSLCAPYWLRGI